MSQRLSPARPFEYTDSNPLSPHQGYEDAQHIISIFKFK